MSEPEYYCGDGLSPLGAFEQGLISRDEFVGFCKGNVIKYVVRAGKKTDDPTVDLVKALDYLCVLIRFLGDGADIGFVDYDGIDGDGLDDLVRCRFPLDVFGKLLP